MSCIKGSAKMRRLIRKTPRMTNPATQLLNDWTTKNRELQALKKWLELARAAGSPRAEALEASVRALKAQVDLLMAAAMAASRSPAF